MNVTVVTVTYGKRTHLLTQVLDAAKAQGAKQAVVINNGSEEPVNEVLASRFADWAHVYNVRENLGSAEGFKAGIEQALHRGAEYILLLDDDNVMAPGCFGTLQANLTLQTMLTDRSLVAVYGFRQDRHQRLIDEARGLRPLRINSTFRGFHLMDIPAKIVKRLGWPAVLQKATPATIVTVCCPYGGLLFHRALISRIGLPNTAFVLYEDDTEFTNRLARQGGRLLLVPGAEIFDLETSWNQKTPSKMAASVWVDGASDLRAFYGFRNGVFTDLYCRGANRPIVAINMICYIFILICIAIAKRRFRRLKLLGQAFCAGIIGRLGPTTMFKL